MAIKLVGALYLIYLGLRALLGSAEPTAIPARGSAFRQGLASNLLNPKIAVFFTSLLPQFVDAQHARPEDPAAARRALQLHGRGLATHLRGTGGPRP
jgi:threonine/homoserine/homoserine lactone efflux protein